MADVTRRNLRPVHRVIPPEVCGQLVELHDLLRTETVRFESLAEIHAALDRRLTNVLARGDVEQCPGTCLAAERLMTRLELCEALIATRRFSTESFVTLALDARAILGLPEI